MKNSRVVTLIGLIIVLSLLIIYKYFDIEVLKSYWKEIFIFGFFYGIFDILGIELPNKKIMVLSNTILFATLFLFNIPVTIFVMIVGGVLQLFLWISYNEAIKILNLYRRNLNWLEKEIIFIERFLDFCQNTIQVFIVYQVYLLSGGGNKGLLSYLTALAASFLFNILIAVVVIGSHKKGFFETQSVFQYILATFLVTSLLSIVTSIVYRELFYIGLILIFVILIIIYYLLKISIRFYLDLKENYLKTIQALAAMTEHRDAYTYGHSDRVSKFAFIIAQEMGLPPNEIEKIRYAGLLHDIGKIGIPEEILNKPSRLSDSEYDIIKQHPVIGSVILEKIDALKPVSDIAKYHHERYDGKGYPEGKKGEEIPLGARIIAIADTFDAITSNRAYRKGNGIEYALEEIKKNAGKQFDPELVKILEKCIEKKLITEKDIREEKNYLSFGNLTLPNYK